MIFRPDLAEKVLAGEKTVTRRLTSPNPRSPWWVGECGYREGREYAVQPGRGKVAIGRIRIRVVRREYWTGSLPLSEAGREGFESREAFVAAFEAINGPVATGRALWRVSFRVVPAALLAAGARDG